jgi:hypothetical protein
VSSKITQFSGHQLVTPHQALALLKLCQQPVVFARISVCAGDETADQTIIAAGGRIAAAHS